MGDLFLCQIFGCTYKLFHKKPCSIFTNSSKIFYDIIKNALRYVFKYYVVEIINFLPAWLLYFSLFSFVKHPNNIFMLHTWMNLHFLLYKVNLILIFDILFSNNFNSYFLMRFFYRPCLVNHCCFATSKKTYDFVLTVKNWQRWLFLSVSHKYLRKN